MKYDIGDLLQSWPFDPDEFVARRIIASDGSEKIQIRIDMGMLQLEVEGRPDGQKPFQCSSLLEYYSKGEDGTAEGGTEGSGALDDQACEDLFQEAWQYYQRYLSLFYLEDYAGVVRDTAHNIEVFDLVQRRAESDEVKWYFEQYYPHAIMMQARSRALLALEKEDYPSALEEVETGVDRIEQLVTSWDGDVLEGDLPELSFLRDWHEELEKERPLSPRERLERDLTVAVESENFEEAALLRDNLRTLRPLIRGPNAQRSSST